VTRVLLVHQPVDGGVARHVADLFNGLLDRGDEPVLCGPGLPSASLLTEGVPPDAPHLTLEMGRSISPASDIVAVRHFRGIARRVRPDLIHAHSSKAGAVARISRLAGVGVPVLYTPHGYAFAGFFEHELERRAYREVERSLASLTSRVVAVCDAEAALARTVTPPRRIRVVHNGIDAPPDGAADPRLVELRRDGPLIAVLTQLRPGKGLETLIDALPHVLARHPAARVALAGDGPERSGLAERARAAGVIDAVTFLGEHPDPIAVLRGADIFLLTSWAESFPYVILEAMAVGLPIVSSDVGGVAEALTDGVTGLLVPARDPGATAAALNRLLADEQLRIRLGTAAHRSVSTRFTRTAMVAGMSAVYRELLEASTFRRKPGR
jgi:glycosyltransferase involved in cell wall biosynthesis